MGGKSRQRFGVRWPSTAFGGGRRWSAKLEPQPCSRPKRRRAEEEGNREVGGRASRRTPKTQARCGTHSSLSAALALALFVPWTTRGLGCLHCHGFFAGPPNLRRFLSAPGFFNGIVPAEDLTLQYSSSSLPLPKEPTTPPRPRSPVAQRATRTPNSRRVLIVPSGMCSLAEISLLKQAAVRRPAYTASPLRFRAEEATSF